MNLMLMLNLLLWAYSLGCQQSYFAPVIYFFVQMMFQGIRELSTALSDPFGDDEVDFPINDWIMTLYSRMYAILEDPHNITQVKLDKVEPLLHPDEVRDKKLIDLYIDLNVDTSDQSCWPSFMSKRWSTRNTSNATGNSKSNGTAKGGYTAVDQQDEDEEEYDDEESVVS